MAVQETLLQDFMTLFSGNKENFGQHRYEKTNSKGEKQGGDNATKTNTPLTQKEYRAHLEGKLGLGVIPITADNTCNFAVLDIDVYSSDVTTYLSAIETNHFPLIPFRSKSGGLHIYLFLENPAPAIKIIKVMNDFASLLALDLFVKNKANKVIETFPKQYNLNNGSIGNWINLPYYDYVNTKQVAIRQGKDLSLDEAIVYIKTRRTTISGVEKLIKEMPFADGPPCLQSMYLLNPAERDSFRNEYLFGMGVYFKKKDASMFEPNLHNINDSLKEPLSGNELDGTIISSMRKKDYNYKCTQSPCVDFCRSALCKTRTFGVGKEGGFFSDLNYGKMYQIDTNPPYYEWEVKLPTQEKFTKLRFRSEEEIIKQDTFLRLCFRALHILPIKLKQSEWFKLVNQALVEITTVKVENDDETSAIAMFKTLFIDFLRNRAVANVKNQLLNKRVYFDKDSNVFYFRASDLTDYIYNTKGFKFISPSEVHGLLSDFNAKPFKLTLDGGKQVRTYGISEKDIGQDVMQTAKEEPFEPNFEQFNKEPF